jgi:hypothetical protein
MTHTDTRSFHGKSQQIERATDGKQNDIFPKNIFKPERIFARNMEKAA